MKRITINLTLFCMAMLLSLHSQGQLLSNFTGFNSGSGFDNAVRAIAEQSDGKLIVGGQFSTYKGVTVNGICRLLQNGELDTTFVNTVNGVTGVDFFGIVLSLKVLDDDRILIGGIFGTVRGVARNSVARLNKDGSIDESFNPAFATTIGQKEVYAIEILPNGNYVFGGVYLNAANNIGICTPTGIVQPITSSSGPSNAITDMKNYPGNRLLISGTFNSGKPFIDRVLLSNFTTDPTFTPYYLGFNANGFNARINTMHVLADGKIIIGGDFTFFAQSTLGQAVAGRLARLDSNGRFDGTFNVGNGFNGRVWQIIPTPAAAPPAGLGAGNFIVCGEFTSYNGTTSNRLAVISPTATLLNSGNFSNSVVYTVHKTRTDNFIVTGGTFTNFNSSSQSRIAVLNATTCLKPVFLQYPTDQLIILGTNRTLQASVLPQTVSDFTWFKNGSLLSTNLASTLSSVSIPAFSNADTGSYLVTANGTCGLTPGPTIKLRVLSAPVLNPLPADTTFCQFANISISASATGQQLSFAWFKDSILRSSTATFSDNSFNASDSGIYKVVVSNSAGSDSAFIRLKLPLPTTIVQQPASVSYCLGDTLNFQVVATGFNLAYQWRRGNQVIPGETNSSLSIVAVAPYTNGTTIRLLITNGCGQNLFATDAVMTQRSTPPTPALSGPSTVCPSFPDTLVYSSTTVASTYAWSLPTGWSGNSTSGSISVFPSSLGGVVSLRVRDTACFSPAASRVVTSVNPARLDSGLVRYWSFNQQDSLRDLVAGVTGTLAGAASQGANAISSSSNTIRFTTTAPLAASVPTTVVIRLTSLFNASFGNFVTFIGSNETTLPAGHPVLVLSTMGRLQAWSNAGTAIGTGTLLGAGVPYTIVLTRNGGNFKIYLNGAAVDSGTNISQAPIGRFFNNRPGFETQGLRGGADEVLIYNRVLSNEEITLLTESPYIAGSWRFAPVLCPQSALNSRISLGAPPDSYQWSINGIPVPGATSDSFNIASLPSTDTLISVTTRKGCANFTYNRRPTFLPSPALNPITGPDTVCAWSPFTLTTSNVFPGFPNYEVLGHLVPQAPTLRYLFDGNTAEAQSGVPFTNLNGSGPLGTYVPNRFGRSNKAHFIAQGTQGLVSPSLTIPNANQNRTWLFWFRNIGNGPKPYLEYSFSGQNTGFVIYRNNGNIGVSNVKTATSGTRIEFPSPFDTVWHHLAVTVNGPNVFMYLDTVLKASGPIQFNPTLQTNQFLVGVGTYISQALSANAGFEIDDLMLYSRALTSTEIKQLYTSSHIGNTNPNSINIGFEWPLSQTVRMFKTGSNGCFNETFKQIVVNPLPAVNISLLGGILTANASGATGFQWFRNDTLITGATASTFQPTVSGTYTVRATAATGCENLSNRLIFLVSGIEKQDFKSNIAVYPNPFEDQLMIDINEECHYQLFNNLGQTVMQGRLTLGNQTLLTDALKPGSYVLRLSEGDKIQTFKLLKY